MVVMVSKIQEMPPMLHDMDLRIARQTKKEHQMQEMLKIEGIAPADVATITSAHGKPKLLHHPHIHFSISYSGTLVMCAAGKMEIGADVEQIRDVNLNDYREHLSAAEYYQLVALAAAEQRQRFFELWTLKESYIKMTGEGVHRPLDNFSVQCSEGRWWLWENGIRNKELYMQHYYPMPGYVAAVCSYEPAPDAITWVD